MISTRSACLLLLITTNTIAHQPVMDMAPRWQGGWGFQFRFEHAGSSDLFHGSSEIPNPFGLSRSVDRTWLEGVYTLRRELRFTFKLPYIDQSRTVLRQGSAVREFGSGVGDLEIGLPLKRYWNRESSTGNLSLTPSIRLPTGDSDDAFPVGDGSTDFGMSLSASFERADLYQFYDLFYWANGSGDRGIHPGNELGLDVNIGWHPYHKNLSNTGVFLMLDFSARYENRGRDTTGVTGGTRLWAGPVFVWYRGGVMLRAEWKVPLHEDLEGVQVSHGDIYNLGIGFVF